MQNEIIDITSFGDDIPRHCTNHGFPVEDTFYTVFAEVDEVCDYCKSKVTPNEYHPGCCGECGAPLG